MLILDPTIVVVEVDEVSDMSHMQDWLGRFRGYGYEPHAGLVGKVPRLRV